MSHLLQHSQTSCICSALLKGKDVVSVDDPDVGTANDQTVKTYSNG